MDMKSKLGNGNLNEKLIKKLETSLKNSKNLGEIVQLSPATLDFLIVGIARYQRTLGARKQSIIDSDTLKAYMQRRFEELREYQKLFTPSTSADVCHNPKLIDAAPNFYFVISEKLRQELEFLA